MTEQTVVINMMEHFEDEQLTFPIWLLADSLPSRWRDSLSGALDPRFPTRHSIWTPVWDEIQATVYAPDKRRVDGERLCICNAAPPLPDGEPDWDFDGLGITGQIRDYGEALHRYRPRIILTFGQRAFEFARRAIGLPSNKPKHWTCKNLGEEFRKRIDDFDPNEPNLFPLLHATIARGHWQQAHDDFTKTKGENYFKFAGGALGDLLKRHWDKCDVWVKISAPSDARTSNN